MNIQALYDCGFHQTVTSQTRLNNILDILLLVNDPLIGNKHTLTCPLGNSDHNKVEFEVIAAIPHEADENESYQLSNTTLLKPTGLC